jgi:hypothetical protein
MLHLSTVLIFIPAAIWMFGIHDKLTSIEYNSYRQEWEKDGRPVGFFWSPPNLRIRLWSYFARDRCALTWLVSTPHWMRGNREALHLVSRLRAIWVVFAVILLPAFLIVNMVLCAVEGR